MEEVRARARLEEERARLSALRQVLVDEHLDAEPACDSVGELSPIDQHQADVASETFEMEKELSIIRCVESDLADVADALGRLERGSYGRCEVCREPIDDQRLEAMPASRFCFAHQLFWEAARLTLTESPPPAAAGSAAVPIERFVEVAAGSMLDLLPGEDDLVERIRLGPEESALHEWLGGRDGGAPMSSREIEAAEARAGDEDAFARSEAAREEAERRLATEALLADEERLPKPGLS